MAKINAWDAEVDGKSATKTPVKAKVKPGMKKEAPSKKVAPKGKKK